MKSLLYFLMLSATCLTTCQQTKVHVNFFLKKSKGDQNHKIKSKSVLLTDENGMAQLACGANDNYILKFNVKEEKEDALKIETEIFADELLISKPVMIVAYNQKGVLKMIDEKTESVKLSLSITPSKKKKAKNS